MGEASRPRAPVGLGAAGRRLWRAVTSDYELQPWELDSLTLACRQLDDVASLEALLAEQGLVVPGSKGQPRLSAVVSELRQARLAAARLLAEVGLPLDDEGRPATPAARRAQRAAQARWATDRALRAVD